MYKLRSDVKIDDNINLYVAASTSKDTYFIIDPRHKDMPYRYLIHKNNKYFCYELKLISRKKMLQ